MGTALRMLGSMKIPHPMDLRFKERLLQKQADSLNDLWVEQYLRMKKQNQQ